MLFFPALIVSSRPPRLIFVEKILLCSGIADEDGPDVDLDIKCTHFFCCHVVYPTRITYKESTLRTSILGLNIKIQFVHVPF